MMDPVSMIHIKRTNARPHSDDELSWWITEYVAGRIPEYQMSAWLMAVCWRGMTPEETAALTRCMVESGDRVDWSTTDMVLVDKHSTGGVGDKISLILAPLLASLGVHVPMMAGRGLGHTGGTIDKLESIDGYQTSLPIPTFQTIVRDVGCSIVSPNATMCPADRKLYALRDVTATVSSLPLQTASIMSKKIAEHPQSLVLDVKYGRGAFQESLEDATALAQSMIATGENNGVATTAVLTRMDYPIGRTVGNWCEVQECIDVMKTGQGDAGLITLVVVQAALLLCYTKGSQYSNYEADNSPSFSLDQVMEIALQQLKSGKVYEKFRDMVQAHGGSVDMIDNHDDPQYHSAQHTHTIIAAQTGYLVDIDALVMGEVAVALGAGRTAADGPVDPAAGLVFHATVGDAVVQDQTAIVTLSTNNAPVLQKAVERVQAAITYGATPPTVAPIVSHYVTGHEGVQELTLPARLV